MYDLAKINVNPWTFLNTIKN